MARTRAAARAAEVDQLHRGAAACRDCRLHKDATQVVFGEGPAPAKPSRPS